MENAMTLIVLLLVLVITTKNLTYGFCSFVLIRILIPESVRLPFLGVSLNTMIILILFVVLLLKVIVKRQIICNKKLFFFLILIISYLYISLLFSNYSDLSAQAAGVFQFIITDILPFVLGAIIINDKRKLSILIKAFLLSCLISTSYGIISYLIQSNPYVSFWSTSDILRNEQWYGNYSTSTFVSTNSFGYFIGLSIPFMMFLRNKNIYSKLATISLVMLVINLVVAKKRTTIIIICFYFFMWFISENPKKRLKLATYSIPFLFVFIFCIFCLPQFESIKNVVLTSLFFWNDSYYNSVTNGIGGSTMGLRLRQFVYPFTEIKDNLLFGHGFGWCGWYLSTGKIHPILFGFESLISQAICEQGLLAILVYPFVFFKLYKFASFHKKDIDVTLFCLTFVVQMIGTGFTYMYLILIIILVMHLVNKFNIKNVN